MEHSGYDMVLMAGSRLETTLRVPNRACNCNALCRQVACSRVDLRHPDPVLKQRSQL
jgi:hypothetical protein